MQADSSDRAVTAAPVFPILDTLRLVGALAVLTTHTAFQTGTYVSYGTFGVFLARLDVGVAIFFVLSGFLLSRPWLAARARHDRAPGLRRYYRKRVVRIWPVYVVTVFAALGAMPDNAGVGPGQWISSLTLTDPYVMKQLPHGLTHMWSLSAEVAFYAVLPLLMWIAVGRRGGGRRLILVLAALGTASILWHAWVAQEVEPHVVGSTGLWLPAYLLWFAGGIALAWLHVAVSGRASPRTRRLAGWFRLPGVCWTVAGAMLLVACTPLAGPSLLVPGTEAESVFKHVTYGVIGVLLVASGVFAPPEGRYARLMSLPLLRHLGHISYGIFCLHLVLLSLAFELTGLQPFTGHWLLISATTLVLTLIVAEAAYRLVEMPAMRRLSAPPRWARRGRDDAETRARANAATTR